MNAAAQPSKKLAVTGAIRPAVAMQQSHEMIISVGDLHAITVDYDPKQLRQNSREALATLLACGIDTNQTTLFIQSDVPEHSELCWLLGSITPLGQLQRMTQFKENVTAAK